MRPAQDDADVDYAVDAAAFAAFMNAGQICMSADRIPVAGLLLGLAAAPLGVAAASGLAVLMGAAAVVHLRHGDPPVRALPAAVLALMAVAYAVTG